MKQNEIIAGIHLISEDEYEQNVNNNNYNIVQNNDSELRARLANLFPSELFATKVKSEDLMKYKNGQISSIIKNSQGNIGGHSGYDLVDMADTIDSIYYMYLQDKRNYILAENINSYHNMQMVKKHYNNIIQNLYQDSCNNSNLLEDIKYIEFSKYKRKLNTELKNYNYVIEDISNQYLNEAEIVAELTCVVSKLKEIYEIYDFFKSHYYDAIQNIFNRRYQPSLGFLFDYLFNFQKILQYYELLTVTRFALSVNNNKAFQDNERNRLNNMKQSILEIFKEILKLLNKHKTYYHDSLFNSTVNNMRKLQTELTSFENFDQSMEYLNKDSILLLENDTSELPNDSNSSS